MKTTQIALNKNGAPIMELHCQVDDRSWWEYSAPGVTIVEETQQDPNTIKTRVDDMTQDTSIFPINA